MASVRTGNIQYGALPYRMSGNGLEILLITSRDRGRWIIPKGWPIAGLTSSQAAAREAWEEAGIKGHVNADSMGAYRYDKRLKDETIRHCAAEVFAMEVVEQRHTWPEQHERRREWFGVEQAIERVRVNALIARASGRRRWSARVAGFEKSER
jgi:8-oxo-dGTP pyrophosphatase MutT (NUDIX family)